MTTAPAAQGPVPWNPYQHKKFQGVSIQNSNGLPSFQLTPSQQAFVKGIQPLLTDTTKSPDELEHFLKQHPETRRQLLNILLPFDYRPGESVLYEFPLLTLCVSYFRQKTELAQKTTQDQFFQKLQILLKYGANLNIFAYDKDTSDGRKYKRPRGVFFRGEKRDTIGGSWHTLAYKICYGGLYESSCHPGNPQYQERKKQQTLALEIMQKLFDLGWDLDIPMSETGRTMVNYAVFKEDEVLLTWLLEHGADPDIVDEYKTHAATEAYKKGNKKLLQLLLRFGSRFSKDDAEKEEASRFSIFQQAEKNASKKRQEYLTGRDHKMKGLLVAHQLMKRYGSSKSGGSSRSGGYGGNTASPPATKRAKIQGSGGGGGTPPLDPLDPEIRQLLKETKQDNILDLLKMTLPPELYSKYVKYVNYLRRKTTTHKKHS